MCTEPLNKRFSSALVDGCINLMLTNVKSKAALALQQLISALYRQMLNDAVAADDGCK